MSENHPNIAAALVALQAELPKVGKSKTNPAFHSKYADLADLTDVVMPVLTRHGFAFTVSPGQTEGGWQITAHLRHESGESIEGSLPLAGGGPQQVGSALTYARRYLLGCLTGVVTDDDDDANAASREDSYASGWTKTKPKATETDAWTTPAKDARPHHGPITEKQKGFITGLAKKAGFSPDDLDQWERFIARASKTIGREIRDLSELVDDEPSVLIERLKGASGE